jgi:hypothetical protein
MSLETDGLNKVTVEGIKGAGGVLDCAGADTVMSDVFCVGIPFTSPRKIFLASMIAGRSPTSNV